MNDTEIAAQIRPEHEKIIDSTIPRLQIEYDRERRKLRIDKTRTYTKFYTIKTAGKNNWLIFIGKPPSQNKYDSTLNFGCFVYYYNNAGIRVFNVGGTGVITVFNAHFFKRYNERLNLCLPDSMDIIKHFFKFNGYAHENSIQKNGTAYKIGFSRDGLLLGESLYNNTWVVWKTFVSRGLVRKDQDEIELELANILQENIDWHLKYGDTNSNTYGLNLDRIIALKKPG